MFMEAIVILKFFAIVLPRVASFRRAAWRYVASVNLAISEHVATSKFFYTNFARNFFFFVNKQYSCDIIVKIVNAFELQPRKFKIISRSSCTKARNHAKLKALVQFRMELLHILL